MRDVDTPICKHVLNVDAQVDAGTREHNALLPCLGILPYWLPKAGRIRTSGAPAWHWRVCSTKWCTDFRKALACTVSVLCYDA